MPVVRWFGLKGGSRWNLLSNGMFRWTQSCPRTGGALVRRGQNNCWRDRTQDQLAVSLRQLIIPRAFERALEIDRLQSGGPILNRRAIWL